MQVKETLNELYMKLGKAYYEGAFEDPLPQLLPLFDKITKLKAHESVNEEKFCVKCGKKMEAGASFCGNCGNRVE